MAELAIIETTDITKAIRYDDVRRLSGKINDTTLSDEDASEIIHRWDDYVIGLAGFTSWDNADTRTKKVITASNFFSAAEKLGGLGGAENKAEADRLTKLANAMVKTINSNSELSVKPTTCTTKGVNNQSGTFG